MQFFSIPVEDGFRDANLTVRDGLRQTAACEQTAGNKRQRPPAGYCCHSKAPFTPSLLLIADALAAHTRPGHIVIYAPGDSCVCRLPAIRSIVGRMND